MDLGANAENSRKCAFLIFLRNMPICRFSRFKPPPPLESVVKGKWRLITEKHFREVRYPSGGHPKGRWRFPANVVGAKRTSDGILTFFGMIYARHPGSTSTDVIYSWRTFQRQCDFSLWFLFNFGPSAAELRVRYQLKKLSRLLFFWALPLPGTGKVSHFWNRKSKVKSHSHVKKSL